MFIHENASENIDCEMPAILFSVRWVQKPYLNPMKTHPTSQALDVASEHLGVIIENLADLSI